MKTTEPATATIVPSVPSTPGTPLPAALAGFHAAPFEGYSDCVLAVVYEGKPHVVCTEGRMLLAVPGSGSFPPPESMNLTAAKIEKTLATPISGERIATSAERLRDWTGPVVPDTVEPCDNCGGNGDCECSDCGCEHPCANCDGSGEQSTHVIRYGRLLNQLVDLDRVSRLMEAVSGECTLGLAVTNRTDSVSMVRIEGTGWLALLMPLDESNLDGEKKEAASRAPVFTAAGET